MEWNRILIAVSLLLLGLPQPAARAQAPLPSFALDPPPSPTSPSIWSGLYVGSGIFAVSGNGSKGHIGGDGQIGYYHEFNNRVVIGVDAIGGCSPGLWSAGPVKGFNFGGTDVRVGYEMGHWMPYVETGVVFAKPTFGAQSTFVSASQATDDLLNGPGHIRAVPRVGAGIDYAVTPNLHVDVNVSGGSGAPLADPFGA